MSAGPGGAVGAGHLELSVRPVAAARRALPGAVGAPRQGRRAPLLCSRLDSVWSQLAPGPVPACPSHCGRACRVGLRKPGKRLSVRLVAAQERPSGLTGEQLRRSAARSGLPAAASCKYYCYRLGCFLGWGGRGRTNCGG